MAVPKVANFEQYGSCKEHKGHGEKRRERRYTQRHTLGGTGVSLSLMLDCDNHDSPESRTTQGKDEGTPTRVGQSLTGS